MKFFQQKDNSGALFKNDRKESDRHPDYTGNAMIDGKEYWVSAWVKEGQRGKFFSFAFKRKDAASPQPGASITGLQKPGSISEQALNKARKPDPISSGQSLRDEMNDDIPF